MVERLGIPTTLPKLGIEKSDLEVMERDALGVFHIPAPSYDADFSLSVA